MPAACRLSAVVSPPMPAPMTIAFIAALPAAHHRMQTIIDGRDARIMLLFDTSISELRWIADVQISDRIGRRIKLHDLHVLMAVVQAGSMSRAAQILNTTQPAVSRSVADLEQTMGVRLL